MAPYVEPTLIPVAPGSYALITVDGVPCVESNGKQVCDASGIDAAKAVYYAHEIQAGTLGSEARPADAPGQTCVTTQRLDAAGVPVGADTICTGGAP